MTDVYQSTPHSGGYYHVAETYWANGLVNTLNLNLSSYPSWTYNPEGEGRLASVTASSGQNPVPTTSPTGYNLFGSPTGVTLGSADSDTLTYDPNTGRMTQYKATINGSSATGSLTWNQNGSLGQLQIADALNSANNQTCAYTHDDLARISQVSCGTGKWGQTFSYDAFGNITKTGTSGQGTSFTPGYNAATNQFSASNYHFDSNGNLLGDGVNNYTWDAEGNLSQFNGATALVYDALGRRVEQTNGSGTNEILYGPGGSKLALMSGQTVTKAFIPLPAGATALYTGATLAWYRHADWLGSSRIASTPSRAVYYDGAAAYSPFGESPTETGNIDHNFTGQNQDLAPNFLYDFLAREYHPGEGRWLSPDPAGTKAVNPANPQSWNRYAYVNGDPLRRTDPKGLCTQWFLPQTGPQGDCVNAGLMASGLNSSTFSSIDSWTNAPVGGLSNKGTMFDVDIGARDQQTYANGMAFMFWTGVTTWAANKFANGDPEHAETIAVEVANLSGGVIDPSKVETNLGFLYFDMTAKTVSYHWLISVSPGVPGLLGPADTPGPTAPSGSQVTAVLAGGPVGNLSALTLSFAQGPAPFNGPCPTHPRSFAYPFDINGAGQCVALGAVPPGLAQPPQPAP